MKKSVEREDIYRRIKKEFETYKKDVFCYRLHELIMADPIFSKLSYLMLFRDRTGHLDNYSHLIKNFLVLPAIIFWHMLFSKIGYKYYKIKYPEMDSFEKIKGHHFNYLVVLNTRDHIITALPVLESLDDKARILVVTFKSVYARYKADFDKLKNTKILFFEYELKNLPIAKYLEIMGESRSKFSFLKSQNLDSDLKRLIEIDKNFANYHLKTELIQYYFFEKIFNAFDIKGTVAIVFTTAFELCKERGIPTFILQHGIGGKGHGHPYVSDYWFTLDDISKKSLDEWLDHTVKVLSVGSPRFEYLKRHLAMQKKEKSKWGKKTRRLHERRNVTFVSEGEPLDNQTTFLALKKLSAELPRDTGLVVKLHPRENLNKSNVKKKMLLILTGKEMQNILLIRREVDFYEVLANSSVVITTTSTGIQEAIACDIPVIQVNFTGKPYPAQYDLSSFGWRTPMDDPSQLVTEVLSLVSNLEKYKDAITKQKVLKERMLKNFGTSGDVIAETLVKIGEKRKAEADI